jgi:hypothetical protein
MPGSPAPFVPTPLPTCRQVEQQPPRQQYVKIDSNSVAIRGATFEHRRHRQRGHQRWLVSANTHGPARLSPRLLNVKIGGKAVHLWATPTNNNPTRPTPAP